MKEAVEALLAARRHLGETIPEPTERQRWALDDLDRAIERLQRAIPRDADEQTGMFGSER